MLLVFPFLAQFFDLINLLSHMEIWTHEFNAAELILYHLEIMLFCFMISWWHWIELKSSVVQFVASPVNCALQVRNFWMDNLFVKNRAIFPSVQLVLFWNYWTFLYRHHSTIYYSWPSHLIKANTETGMGPYIFKSVVC